MTPTATLAQNIQSVCVHCASMIERGARFCGDCGAGITQATNPLLSFTQGQHFFPGTAQAHLQTHHNVTHPAVAHPQAQTATQLPVRHPAAQQTPAFAQPHHKRIPQELTDELSRCLASLVRERLFLGLHCLVFLSVNLFGFTMAMQAYFGYNADEVTRFIIALTPLMFINTMSLCLLATIKRTRKEIAKLQDRLHFLKVRIDYSSAAI